MLESVVALAILALALTAIYQIFGWTLRQAAEQRQRDWAWMTAQSLLDLIRIEGSRALGQRSGHTLQGLTWQTVVEPFPARAGPTTPAVLQVTIKVSWGERAGRHIELRSVEFGAVQ